MKLPPPNWIDSLWVETVEGKLLGHLSLLDFGDQEKIISGNYVFGCNYSIRKKLLDKVGGFNPDGFPRKHIMYRGDGETAVGKKIQGLNYKAYFHPQASVYHYVPKNRMTIEYFESRSYAQGISDSYTAIRERGEVLNSDLYLIKSELFNKFGVSQARDEIQEVLYQSYMKGYYEHHLKALREKRILEWIIRENYLGDNLLINI